MAQVDRQELRQLLGQALDLEFGDGVVDQALVQLDGRPPAVKAANTSMNGTPSAAAVAGSTSANSVSIWEEGVIRPGMLLTAMVLGP